MTTTTAGTMPCKKLNLHDFTFDCSQLCKSDQYAYRSKNVFRLNVHRQRSFQKKVRKISHCGSRFPTYVSRCFVEDSKEIYQYSTH